MGSFGRWPFPVSSDSETPEGCPWDINRYRFPEWVRLAGGLFQRVPTVIPRGGARWALIVIKTHGFIDR